MKPKIWIDIDDVLAETAKYSTERLHELYEYKITFDEICHFDYTRIPGFPLNLEDTTLFFRSELSHPQSINRIKVLPHTVESLTILEKHFELHAITARHECTRETTMEWLGIHFPDTFSGIDFLALYNNAHGKRSKGDACVEFWLEAFIEDNIDYALTVVEKGIPCLLLERPWNKNRTEEHPLLIRVKDWVEAENEILRMYCL